MVDFSLKRKWFTYAFAILLSTSGAFFGYYLAIFNPLFGPLIDGVYQITDETERLNLEGNVFLLFAIGALVGVLFTGSFADIIGRLIVAYVSEVLALACCGMWLIQNMVALQILRFLWGLASGATVWVSAIILSELFNKKICGFGNSLVYIFIVVFILIGYIQQNVISRENIITYWRVIIGWMAGFVLIKLILLPFFLRTDTPKYIFFKNCGKEGYKMKEKISEIYKTFYSDDDASAAADEAIVEFNIQKSQENVTYRTLFEKHYRMRTISGLVLAFAQQITGINFLIFFLDFNFRQTIGKRQGNDFNSWLC